MINRNIKNKFAAFFISFLAIMFSGCENDSAYYENLILEKSGISSDEDYVQYQKLNNNGQLDSNGFYINDEAIPAMAEVKGTVHVTFANNEFLEISYYYDRESSIPVDTTDCYVNPGDSIYYSLEDTNNKYSNRYEFKEFRIYKFDEKGQKNEESSCKGDKENQVLKIPNDYSGTELSVEPIGRYLEREITFNAYSIDGDGTKHDINTGWYINNVRSNTHIETIKPTGSYSVKFEYDNNEYYFDTAEPTPLYPTDKKENNGTVQFYEMSSTDETNSFTVQLRRFIVVDISGDTKKIKTIKVNGEETKIDNLKLKYNDAITIDIDSNYTITCTQMDLGSPEMFAEYNRYSFRAESMDTLNFVIRKESKKNSSSEILKYEQQKIKNAEIKVTLADSTIKYTLVEGNNIEESDNVIVTITPNEGYYITGSDVSNNVYKKQMKYSKYLKDIDSIIKKHPIEKYIKVTLKSSDSVGTYKFTLDGKEVSGTIQLQKGQELKLEYTITDTNYKIKTGLFGSIFASDKVTDDGKLKITEEYDGKTLTKEDFGIEIEMKEK